MLRKKYKINYNFYGGANYYLPCEITHYTSNVYYNERINPIRTAILNEIIGPSMKYIPTDSKYFQDPMIQLYNEKDYINIILGESANIVNNIIEASIICICEKCLYLHKNPERNREYNKGDKIPRLPLFQHADPNCIKDIKKIEYKPEFLEFNGNNTFHIISRDEIIGKPTFEASKGGNFIGSPNKKVFYLNKPSNKTLELLSTHCKLVQLNCSFVGTGKAEGFRHIDELMCFMPYGIGEYKVWFYNLNEKSFGSEHHKNKLEEYISEMKINRDIVSIELFGGPYSEHSDKFVMIDYYAYKPTFMNRVWVEKNGINPICLLPNDGDALTRQFVITEMGKVKSMISGKPVEYRFIDIPIQNELEPEGGLHCMIKQTFIHP